MDIRIITFWFVVGALAILTMLFETRHIDNTEHHCGMMMMRRLSRLLGWRPSLIVGSLSFTSQMSSDKIDLLDVAASTYESPNILP
ncbi:hypothetical protein O9992_08005 [Vibrio lentus]|nr:hypothetical protein [Vibrio lentus]